MLTVRTFPVGGAGGGVVNSGLIRFTDLVDQKTTLVWLEIDHCLIANVSSERVQNMLYAPQRPGKVAPDVAVRLAEPCAGGRHDANL